MYLITNNLNKCLKPYFVNLKMLKCNLTNKPFPMKQVIEV